MAVNKYFPKGISSEQIVYQSLVTESIQVQGMDVYYLPRKTQKLDLVFGEDVLSKFDTAVKIEMYMQDNDAWQGQNDFISKFGLQVKEQMSFILSKPRWEEVIKPVSSQFAYNKIRPQEGDLIYDPMTDNLFEITYVSLERPYYQLNKTYQWTLTCELFIYSNEKLDTGIAKIDKLEEEFGNDILNYQISLEDGYQLKQENGNFMIQNYTDERNEFQFDENSPIKEEAPEYNFNVNDPFGEVK